MGKTELLTQQLDVFAKVLATLFDLESPEDLEPALEFVYQHIDFELFAKLSGSNGAVNYHNAALRSEIEFLIFLKFTELEILEKMETSSIVLKEKSMESLAIITAFLNENAGEYHTEIENIGRSLVLKLTNS